MNITETQEMRERLESVINAATKYGTQADQLASTRVSLTEYLSQVKETNAGLLSLTEQTRKVLEDTGKLANGVLTNDLQPEIDKVHSMIDDCEKKLDVMTQNYHNALQDLESSKEILASQHHQAETLLAKTVGEVKESLLQAENAVSKLEKDNASGREQVINSVKETFANIEKAITDLPEMMQALTSSVKIAEEEQTKVVSGLTQSMNTVSGQMNQLATLPKANGQILDLINQVSASVGNQISGIESRIIGKLVDGNAKIHEETAAFSNELQSRIASLSSDTEREVHDLKDEIKNIQTKQQEIESAISEAKSDLVNVEERFATMIQDAVKQSNAGAKQQKMITVGCAAITIVLLIILLVVK